MKKISLILAVLMCFSVTAFAEPALTWDDSPPEYAVDKYQVDVDGQIVAEMAPNTWVIVNLADGAHVSKVRAHNAKGWGQFGPTFSFTTPYLFSVPPPVTGQKIIDFTPPTP